MSLKQNYIKWYNKNVIVKTISGNIKSIELPFQCGDMISFIIIPLKNHRYRISDDGWCLEDVDHKLNIVKLNRKLDAISIYNVHLTSEADLTCDVSKKDIFSALHGMTMAYGFLYNKFH